MSTAEKSHTFFSKFTFRLMREWGNTHFCFACLSRIGFTPGLDGKPANHTEKDGYDGMASHDKTHEGFVVGNAYKYDNAEDWIEEEIPKGFPLIVHVSDLP